MLKLIALILGLAIGFGGGVWWASHNPDQAKPEDTFLTTSYGEAYDAALKRATIGANPKPSARTRKLYDDAFAGALV